MVAPKTPEVSASQRAMNAHIGRRIRELRKNLKLTQKTLGERVGRTPQQIQKYENGSNGVSAARLDEIGGVLGKPAHYFYRGGPTAYHGGGVEEEPADAFVYDAMSAEERELATLIGDMGDAQAVKGLVEFIYAVMARGRRIRS